MKKTLLTTTALVAGFAAAANAVDVEMYGQVNKGVMIFNDGESTEFNVVDNDFASTRFGVKGSQQLDNGLTASVLLEAEMQSNASDAMANTATPSTPASTANVTFAERQARVGLAGNFGAVFLGQMSTATDGVTEQDLAGANDVLGSDIEDIGGALQFRTSATALSGESIAANTNNMDGNDRADAIRYDSPIYNGFQARVSAAQGGDLDLGVFYKGKYDAFDIAAAIGWVSNNDNAAAVTSGVESTMSGSVSVKHDSGLAGTFAYGKQSLSNAAAGIDEPTFYYLKAGYSWDAFEVAADYSNHQDMDTTNATDHEVKYYGIAGQYNLGNGVSTAVYYKNFEYDETGVNADDIQVYGVNMRVKF